MYGSDFSILLLAALLLDSAAAQGPGDLSRGTPDMNRGGSNPGTSRFGPSWPLSISGDVRTSSGEAPTEPVSIKRLCGAETFIEGYSGRKGRFSFQIGGYARFTDATVNGTSPGVPQSSVSFNSVRSNVGPGVDLSDCRLIADLPGYRSSSIQLGRRRHGDRPPSEL
jgi:hypothetical protein